MSFLSRRPTISQLAAAAWRTPVVVVAALLSTVLVTLFDVIVPLLAGSAVDTAMGKGNLSWPISQVVTVLICLALGRYAAQFTRRYTAGRLSNTVQHTLRVAILATLQRLDGKAQDQLRTGQVVSRSISDLNLTQAMLAMVPLMIGHLLKIIATIALMLWISPLLAVVSIAVLPLVVWLSVKSRSILFAATWSAQQAVADLSTHVEETVSGVRVVKAFHQEKTALDRLDHLARNVYGQMMRTARLSARFKPLLQQLPTLALVVNIGIGGYLAHAGTITVGTFLAFSVYMMSLSSVVSMMAGMVVQIQLGLSSASRVFDVINLKPVTPEPDNPMDVPSGALGVSIHNLAFANGSHSVLTGVDLTISPGETLALVGPAGSGKTMLVQLLCGFYPPDAGSIQFVNSHGVAADFANLRRDDIRKHLACVFEDPFLYSTTIFDNIDMGRGLSEAEVRQAAQWAQALDFIENLEGGRGFSTNLGERGLTLSGGQRQRIALARALAGKPEVLVLDDATSAIDATTEAKIFAALTEHFADTTIITIAHRHSTLEHADTVALIEDGQISAHGSLADMRTHAQFSHLMDLGFPPTQQPAEALPFDDGDEPSWEQLWPKVASGNDRLKMKTHTMRNAASMAGANPLSGGRGTNRGGMAAAAAMPATPKLLAQVDALPAATAIPRVNAAEFTQPLKKVTAPALFFSVRWLIAGVIGLYVISVLAGLSIPSLIRFSIDQGVVKNNVSIMWQVTLAGLVLVIVAWAADVATTILTSSTGEKLLYGLRIRSYAHLQRLGLSYFEATNIGTIMTRMTTDIDALGSFLQSGLAILVVALTTLVGIIILLVITSPTLALIALIGVPIIALFTVVFRRISVRLYARAREEISDVNALFHESMRGLRTEQMHQMHSHTLNRFERTARKYLRTRISSQTAVALYFPGINAVSEILQAVVLAAGAGLVASGNLPAGVLVAFLLYLDRLYGPIQHLSQVFDAYSQAQVGLRRISALLATTTDVVDNPKDTPPAATLTSGPLELSNISFTYRGYEALVLDDINLAITPGTTVAVVGPTGAGKSTLAKLIERFYDPTEGAITIHGVNIRDLPLGQWRNSIGYVPQEAHLFAGTIASNIAYGKPEATQEEITAAARQVGALHAIALIPGGFNAEVTEQGHGLSSGQRQLVALARAEIMQPQLLVFDEATATLDPATEKTILKAAQRVLNRRTAVVIAHRLATARRADRVIVIHDGRIVEDGTHESLLSFGGIYATMWEVTNQ